MPQQYQTLYCRTAGDSFTLRSFGHYESRLFGLPCVIIDPSACGHLVS